MSLAPGHHSVIAVFTSKKQKAFRSSTSPSENEL
jgi:hypothetical protein